MVKNQERRMVTRRLKGQRRQKEEDLEEDEETFMWDRECLISIETGSPQREMRNEPGPN